MFVVAVLISFATSAGAALCARIDALEVEHLRAEAEQLHVLYLAWYMQRGVGIQTNGPTDG